MNFEEFKNEYTKESVEINNINFSIKKIPAFKSIVVFTNIMNKLSSSFKNIDDEKNILSLAMSFIAGLDSDYLEKYIMPTFFEHIEIDYKQQKIKLKDSEDLIKNDIDFADLYELIIRVFCVNFLVALTKKVKAFQGKKKAIEN